MDYVFDLIKSYGEWFYVITFIWTFFEGETFVIFAGLAAAHDILRLDLLILAAWSGSYCCDQTMFYLGRRFGPRILDRFPKMRPGVESALGWTRKNSTVFILTFRFIYGVRNFASFAIGMSGVTWPRFAVLNFIAAGVWAISFAGAGYILGEVLGAVIGEHIHTAMVGMLVLFIVIVGGKFLLKRRAKAA